MNKVSDSNKNTENSKRPFFSIVTPAYNIERYIGGMLESVLAQNFADWELIVADDGSTDLTGEIIKGYVEKDSRIRMIRLKNNSGSCFLPRRKAIEASSGKYIVNVDADDYISENYLESFYKRIKETDADIVYAEMIFVEEDKPEKRLDTGGIDTSQVYEGHVLMSNTLDHWEISGVAATKRDIIEKSFAYYDAHPQNREGGNAFDNEFLTRLDLFYSKRVAFSDSRYYYRQLDTSVIHKATPGKFSLLRSDRRLQDFILREYGRESKEYMLSQKQMFHHTIEFIRLLNKNKHLNRNRELKNLTRESLKITDRKKLRGNVSNKYFLLTGLGFDLTKFFLNFYGKE